MLHFVALCCALHFVVPGVWDTCNFMSQIEGSNATRQVKDLPVLLASDLARRGPESQTHSHIDSSVQFMQFPKAVRGQGPQRLEMVSSGRELSKWT